MTPEQLTQAFGEIVSSNTTVALVFLILANLVLGVLNAMKDGKFTLEELSGILKKVLPYVFAGYFGLGTVGELQGGITGEVISLLGTILGMTPFAVGTVKEGRSLGLIPKPISAVVDKLIPNKV